MSILKSIDTNQRTLYGMIEYSKDNRKAPKELLYGFGVNPMYAYEEMQLVKQLFNKIGGRQYKQIIFSFDSDIKLPNVILKEIGYHIRLYYVCAHSNSMLVKNEIIISLNNILFTLTITKH
ncbi:MAG: hypothetical protein K0R55_3144 [Sporomusa sp.]|nr:hypothetical protein [Sporomusa sp.]